jgi:hypothetical protein
VGLNEATWEDQIDWLMFEWLILTEEFHSTEFAFSCPTCQSTSCVCTGEIENRSEQTANR